MTVWRPLPALRRVSFCPVALDLRDEFTGQPAFGPLRLMLDLQEGAGWRETGRMPVRNAGGVHLYTGLGRTLDPAAAPGFRVRVRIEAAYYRPAFRTTDDGLEFDVPTYNDTVPPAVSPLVPEVVLMLPAAAYPFAAHVRRLAGRVIDPAGMPVADATVAADGVERVMTGPDGAFTLPLRWQAPTASVNVAVDHPRSGRAAAQVLVLPGALGANHDITVS